MKLMRTRLAFGRRARRRRSGGPRWKSADAPHPLFSQPLGDYIQVAGLRGALGVHIPRGLIDPEGSCP